MHTIPPIIIRFVFFVGFMWARVPRVIFRPSGDQIEQLVVAAEESMAAAQEVTNQSNAAVEAVVHGAIKSDRATVCAVKKRW
jgi:hypothetical protein